MESWCLVKHKSPLLILMMLLIFMVGWIQGIQIEDEKRALLEIKASLHEVSNFLNVNNLLPTWVDHGSTGGKHCDWERIKCNTTSGYVTDLSLGDMFSIDDGSPYSSTYEMLGRRGMTWPLNVSVFLRFKELRRLDLSWNYIGNTFASTGLERLSGLKNLEKLNLSINFIETNIFPSLSELTSLKILDLSFINGYQGDSPTHDISEFRFPENLEVLDVRGNGYYGTLQMQGFERVSILRKLKFLNLGGNYFNESLITSLSAHGSLEVLDLSSNQLSGLFPAQELNHLTNLKKLDLSFNNLNITPSIQGCKSLMRLERLESISLGFNYFNDNIISCLSFLPSLKILDLSYSDSLGRSFPRQELSSLRELTTLDLSDCRLESLTLNGTMSKLQHLNLDFNHFNDDIIMMSMSAFPSLRYLSLEHSFLFVKEGRRFPDELPNLPDLEVLILSDNNFNGTLPIEALASSFPHLTVLDLSFNNFVGGIPSTLKLLSSLKAVSFSFNNLNGSLSNNGLCELENLEEMDISYNMFNGNLPKCFCRLSSLKLFDISSNRFTGMLLSSLVTNLTSLEYADFSSNKFEGSFSFSSFSNHTKLELVAFKSDNDKFEVETEEPMGWTPMFQFKVLVLSNCNINKAKGSVVPGFLLHQHKLKILDISHNSLEGQFPNWLINNNTMLKVLNLRDNSFGNTFCMPFYMNFHIRGLDISINHMRGVIPEDIQKFFPSIAYLNLSKNSLEGVIPPSIGDLSELQELDLSHNELSGEVPIGLFTNLSDHFVLKLSNNCLCGEILSRDLNLNYDGRLHLDSNYFTGKIRNMSTFSKLSFLDISNNHFTGSIPDSISNMSSLFEHDNSLLFLDISQNRFSGSIPSYLDLQNLEHLHLGSNKFTGSLPNSFRNLTKVLTLDVGNNYLSGEIPKFLGELSTLRILLLGKNNFHGSIPRELCQLTNASLVDLSRNFLSGSIPSCLQNIRGPSYQAFMHTGYLLGASLSDGYSSYQYRGGSMRSFFSASDDDVFKIQDKVLFTTKTQLLPYKGDVLDIMSGLDLSCNKLTGQIPEELGLLTQIHVLNLSHNRLTGPIPVKFSNLASIESLDLSSNSLTGEVPSELIKLNSLEVFNVSYNNLSGRLPETKAQFGTFSKESYEGNPLLCGLPLESKCMVESRGIHSSNEEGNDDKWDDIDKASFYGSFISTWIVFISGFAAILYVNPYWRRRWLELVEECMYTCYYFLYYLVRKVCMLFFK